MSGNILVVKFIQIWSTMGVTMMETKIIVPFQGVFSDFHEIWTYTCKFLVLTMCHPFCSLYFPARMHRKNGQFASLKESSGGSSWGSGQSCLQDGTPRPETVWVVRLIWSYQFCHLEILSRWLSLMKFFTMALVCNLLFLLLWCVSVFGDVNIVVLVKIILLQCVVGQLDQGLSVMHVALCGPTRFVFFWL